MQHPGTPITGQKESKPRQEVLSSLLSSPALFAEWFDSVPVGLIFVDHQGKVTDINYRASKLLGVERDRLLQQNFCQFVDDNHRVPWQQNCLANLVNSGMEAYIFPLKKHINSVSYNEISCQVLRPNQCDPILAITIINATNANLDAKSSQLNPNPEGTNRYREDEKANTQQALNHELGTTILPLLARLKAASTGRTQVIRLIEALESNLQHLVQTYGCHDNLSAAYAKLTPTESQVASLVKQGLSTKVIASTLSISIGTVEIHRKHIRKKLGLNSKGINLRNHLRTLTESA